MLLLVPPLLNLKPPLLAPLLALALLVVLTHLWRARGELHLGEGARRGEGEEREGVRGETSEGDDRAKAGDRVGGEPLGDAKP